MCLLLVHASFAETVKASEPLSTVALGAWLLKKHSSRFTYMSLIPICGGVALACIQTSEGHSQDSITGASTTAIAIGGFLLAAASNVCFSFRAVLAKQLSSRQFAGLLDESSLFHHVSAMGLLVLVPCALLFEGWKVVSNLFLPGDTFRLLQFIMLIALNGCAYTSYNLASFFVLSRAPVVVHAVLNVFRRVAIILVTAMVFGVKLHTINAWGIAVAVSGVLMFSIARSREASAVPRLAGPGAHYQQANKDTGMSSRD